jgi:Skp family chaperone for outer membrane proteins
MKRTIASLALPLALLCAGAFAQTAATPAAPSPSAAAPATSGPAGPAKIGIINIQQAIAMTNEGKRDIEGLEKKFDPKRQELQTLNKEVEDLKKQLDSQGSKLNDDARTNLVKSIETKQKSLQRQAEDAQNDYQGQQQELVNRIGTKLMEALDKFAKTNGFSMIIDVSGPQNPVLWAQPNVDVTQQVAAAYNASSPVAAPAGRPATASSNPRPAAPSAPSASTPK